MKPSMATKKEPIQHARPAVDYLNGRKTIIDNDVATHRNYWLVDIDDYCQDLTAERNANLYKRNLS